VPINKVMSPKLHSDAVHERVGEMKKLLENVIYSRGKYNSIILYYTCIILLLYFTSV